MSDRHPSQPVDASGHITPARKLAIAVTALIYLAGAAAIYVFIDHETLQKALSLPLSLVAALLGLSLFNYAVRAWRWAVMAGHLDFGVPVATNTLYYLAGYCLTSTPGKAGEAIRLWFLRSGHGVPYQRSLPLMLADRIVDAWAVLLLTLASMAGFAAHHWQGALLAVLVTAVSIPVLFPRWFAPLLDAVHRCFPGHGAWLERAREIMHAMAELSSWRTYGLTLVPSIAGWLAECAALYFLLRYFGADVSFASAVFVFSFSLVVGAISMLPGGLGSTEAAIVLLLKALGVSLDVALAATAIIRITTFWFAVGIGMLLMPAALNAAARAAAVRPARGVGAG